MMTQNSMTEQGVKVQELKKRFEDEGFTVVVAPQRSDLPFDLEHFAPDLVARKGDGGLIVEVKPANARKSIDRYQAVAATVQQHPGWRFLLVTVEDLNFPTTSNQLASWDALQAKLVKTRALIEGGNTEPAVLYLWSVWEAAMRKLAIEVAMPIERLPASKMMNQLYTAGYIGIDDFAIAKAFLNMRNGITHGFGTEADGALLDRFLAVVCSLINEWKNERLNSELLNG